MKSCQTQFLFCFWQYCKNAFCKFITELVVNCWHWLLCQQLTINECIGLYSFEFLMQSRMPGNVRNTISSMVNWKFYTLDGCCTSTPEQNIKVRIYWQLVKQKPMEHGFLSSYLSENGSVSAKQFEAYIPLELIWPCFLGVCAYACAINLDTHNCVDVDLAMVN